LKPGVNVKIGMQKSSCLADVFNRFVGFCNEQSSGTPTVKVGDLEFVHSALLEAQDSAEAAALMKNDRILVRPNMGKTRLLNDHARKEQRKSDREYFDQLNTMLSSGDILLDCQGSTSDDDGNIQRVLSTTVRCHSAIASSRCKWLGNFIRAAKMTEEPPRAAVVEDETQDVTEIPMDDEDGAIQVVIQNDSEQVKEKETSAIGATKIEDEEELDPAADIAEHEDLISIDEDIDQDQNRYVRVKIPDHSPQAMRILLEFCYTNRVRSLGYEAFRRSYPPSKNKRDLPVPPFEMHPNRWPNSGKPTLSFHDAMATLRLAEDAGMKRLSLMCECAAAQLVSSSTYLDALATCEKQNKETGNALPILRKSCVSIVFRPGSRRVFERESFRQSLTHRSALIVPPLLIGTAEAATRKKKRDWHAMSYVSCPQYDYDDKIEREKERHERRVSRIVKEGGGKFTAEQLDRLFEQPRRKDSGKRKLLKRSAQQWRSQMYRSIHGDEDAHL